MTTGEDSSVMTFRIPSRQKNELELEAQKDHTTLNSLIKKILTKHLEWDRFTKEAGFLFATKAFQRSVLSKLNESEMTEIARTTCKSAFRDAVIFIYNELTLQNFLATCDLWLNASNLLFRHAKKNHTDTYLISHNIGKNWSVYFSTLVKSFEDDLKFSCNATLNTHSLRLIIKNSQK